VRADSGRPSHRRARAATNSGSGRDARSHRRTHDPTRRTCSIHLTQPPQSAAPSARTRRYRTPLPAGSRTTHPARRLPDLDAPGVLPGVAWGCARVHHILRGTRRPREPRARRRPCRSAPPAPPAGKPRSPRPHRAVIDLSPVGSGDCLGSVGSVGSVVEVGYPRGLDPDPAVVESGDLNVGRCRSALNSPPSTPPTASVRSTPPTSAPRRPGSGRPRSGNDRRAWPPWPAVPAPSSTWSATASLTTPTTR